MSGPVIVPAMIKKQVGEQKTVVVDREDLECLIDLFYYMHPEDDDNAVALLKKMREVLK